MAKVQFTASTVQHIAQLANIPVTPAEEEKLSHQFGETLDVIANLKELDVTQTEPTHQVTGLENVMRPDIVDEQRMFTQAQALANASHTHQGYFVVPQVIAQD